MHEDLRILTGKEISGNKIESRHTQIQHIPPASHKLSEHRHGVISRKKRQYVAMNQHNSQYQRETHIAECLRHQRVDFHNFNLIKHSPPRRRRKASAYLSMILITARCSRYVRARLSPSWGPFRRAISRLRGRQAPQPPHLPSRRRPPLQA